MHLATTLLTLVLVSSTADASPASAVHGDVEVDPTAYALSGYSLHVGISGDHLRLDLGNFALALPQVFHGDDGFDVSFDGYGAKLQYFIRGDRVGLFGGVDASVLHVDARRQGTDLAAHDTQVQAGVHLGYRIALPADFYVTPWIGVSYAFSAADVTLGGTTYEPARVNVFPAVHVGYRFN